MASAAVLFAPVPQAPGSTPFERRLREEWALLAELAAHNPDRLTDLAADDTTFWVTLHATPALSLEGESILDQHRLRLDYPRFFPALPLELSLETPVFHPNVHALTGFVCLWDRHRTSNTVEHALHKTVAMLGWKLLNSEPRHTMQPAALALAPADRETIASKLEAAPLTGVRGFEPYPPAAPASMRRRLS